MTRRGRKAFASFVVQRVPLALWDCGPCRSAKVSDEEERRSFLENVAAHRDIVDEWTSKK
jgi:hypothetical protein